MLNVKHQAVPIRDIKRLSAMQRWRLECRSRRCPLGGRLRTQGGHGAKSEKCQTATSRMPGPKEKAARRRLSNSNLTITNQVTSNAVFDFRRYAMKPMPAKPRIIIAHVEGSGTADTAVNTAKPISNVGGVEV
jgi:hypothetical protein